MRCCRLILAAATVSVLLITPFTQAEVSRLINYQGILTDTGGTPLDGPHDLTFTIYPDSATGTSLWSELHPAVLVDAGLFNVILGGATAIPDSIFDSGELWMGTIVGVDPEISPRMRLASVAWAFRAAVAESALAVSEVPAHEHDADYINDGGGEVDAADDFGFASSTFVSNLDADKLDGKDAAELMMPGIPEGSIIMWSGVIDGNGHPLVDGTPDTNWYICDGANGTPNLRDRFIIGSGSTYSTGATGGSTSRTLAIDNMPSHNHPFSATTGLAGLHNHTYYDWASNWSTFNAVLFGGSYAVTVNQSGTNIESLTDLQPDHSHTVSGNTSSVGNGQSFSVMPPYYALAFIMYIPG